MISAGGRYSALQPERWLRAAASSSLLPNRFKLTRQLALFPDDPV